MNTLVFEVNYENTRTTSTDIDLSSLLLTLRIYLIIYSIALFITLNIYLTAELSVCSYLVKANNGNTRRNVKFVQR